MLYPLQNLYRRKTYEDTKNYMVMKLLKNYIDNVETPIPTFIGAAGSYRNNYANVVASANIQQLEPVFYNTFKFDRDIATNQNYGSWTENIYK